MRIIYKLLLRLERIFARFKDFLGVDAIVKYGKFSIVLPATHLLPLYQKNHRLYDRFLPHLASVLNKGDWIVDVGANCGDTLASIVDINPGLNFFCIEPDDLFFSYLNRNANILKGCLGENQIFLEKSLVGKSVKSANLVGSGGTKRSVVNSSSQESLNGTLKSCQLDDLFIARFGTSQPIRLIKSDVDGFDFDVLSSAEILINRWHPLVYFEMHCFDVGQKNGFESVINDLAGCGYVRWIVFDNFGEVVFCSDNASDVIQLGNYVWRLNSSRSTRTVYYFDILACCSEDVSFVDSVIESYLDL